MMPDPRLEYTTRLAARRQTVARYEALDARLALVRLGIFAVFLLILALSLWWKAMSPWWLLLPPPVFLAVAVTHDRVIKAKRHAATAVEYYEKGLARIDDRWMGTGLSTEPFADEGHLYATDLDLFGRGSLFELLCTARTRSGQETLARWLCEPATPAEIRARQRAIDELRARVDLREDLAVIGTSAPSSLKIEALIAWGTAPRGLTRTWPRWIAGLLSAWALTAMVMARLFDTPLTAVVFEVALCAATTFAFVYRARVQGILGHAEAPHRELTFLAHLLGRLEHEPFESERLVALRAAMDRDGMPPTTQIARFDRLMYLIDFKRLDVPISLLSLAVWQLLFAPFSFLFWLTHLAFAIEAWRGRHGRAIEHWVRIAGEFDALCAMAGYAYEHPADPFPEIVETGPLFEGEALRHPLLPSARSMPNTVRMSSAMPLIVVSGSNMSGKSTLLRTVGINTVLALAGAPVRATRLRVSPLTIGATIRIHDSIQAGTSRFYSEIQRIRSIVGRARDGAHVLFLLDELLHGTNSHDRALGAAAIIRELTARGGIGLATTHDLALTGIAESMAPRAMNVHFRDEFTDGRMTFDYKMHPGIAEKSNALALMLAVGLDVDGAQ